MNNTIVINGQTISVPEGMQINFANGGIQIVPCQTRKSVRVPYGTKAGQKVETKSLTETAKKAKTKKVYETEFDFSLFTKENKEFIKTYFIAKNGQTIKGDVEKGILGDAELLHGQKELSHIPVGVIGWYLGQLQKSAAYGNFKLPSEEKYLEHFKGTYVAKMFTDLTAKRIAKFAQTPMMS